MRDLVTTARTTEGKAMDYIFAACRTNPTRKPWRSVDGFRVNFYPNSCGLTYEAILRNPENIVVAAATVDDRDC